MEKGDKNKDGVLQVDEFVDLMKSLKGATLLSGWERGESRGDFPWQKRLICAHTCVCGGEGAGGGTAGPIFHNFTKCPITGREFHNPTDAEVMCHLALVLEEGGQHAAADMCTFALVKSQ